MIEIKLADMIAAAETPVEDEAEKIAFSDIPGPPIVSDGKRQSAEASPEAEGKSPKAGPFECGD